MTGMGKSNFRVGSHSQGLEKSDLQTFAPTENGAPAGRSRADRFTQRLSSLPLRVHLSVPQRNELLNSALLTHPPRYFPAMSLSTCAEEFDSASHNLRPALGRGLRMRPKRCVKKKRCMLTDSPQQGDPVPGDHRLLGCSRSVLYAALRLSLCPASRPRTS
jgi:hypothetical protein